MPGGFEVRRVAGHLVVERAAVGRQRVDEVGPRDHRRRGGDLHVLAPRALPRGVGAVGVADAVPQRGELHALAAAVGAAGHADLLGLDQVLVGQQAGQVLGVAGLVAGVGQVDPALRAAGRVGRAARRGRAARLAEAASGVVEDGVAPVGPGLRCDPRRDFEPPHPCSWTTSGNGPSPVAGRVTLTSSGTPSWESTRLFTSPGQKRTPSCGGAGQPERRGRGLRGGRERPVR